MLSFLTNALRKKGAGLLRQTLLSSSSDAHRSLTRLRLSGCTRTLVVRSVRLADFRWREWQQEFFSGPCGSGENILWQHIVWRALRILRPRRASHFTAGRLQTGVSIVGSKCGAGLCGVSGLRSAPCGGRWIRSVRHGSRVPTRRVKPRERKIESTEVPNRL